MKQIVLLGDFDEVYGILTINAADWEKFRSTHFETEDFDLQDTLIALVNEGISYHFESNFETLRV